jgi:hypothetical protein
MVSRTQHAETLGWAVFYAGPGIAAVTGPFPILLAVSCRVEELARPRRFYLEYYNNNR